MTAAVAHDEPRFDPSVLDDPSKFTKVRGVTVFDEHQEKNAKGEVVENFDKKRLERIADRCNRRDATGQLCPLAIGHTVDDEKDDKGKVVYKAREEDQPELCGYARKFRVKFSKKLNRHVIKTDWYIANDKYEKASTFPRVSVERWKDGVIDPISLLRRTPARDLGQWTYAKAMAASVQGVYGGDGADLAGAVWKYNRRGKHEVVRYAMAEFDRDDEREDDNDEPRGAPPEDTDSRDPTEPAGAQIGDESEGKGDEPDDGGAMKELADRMSHHASCKYCRDCYAKSMAGETPGGTDTEATPDQYGAAAAFSPTNGSLPGGKTVPDDKNKAPDRNGKGSPAKNARESIADRTIRDARPAKAPASKRESELEARLSKLEAERVEDRKRYARSEADKLVTQLADVDGYLLGNDEDRAGLRDQFAEMIGKGDEAAVKSLYARVKRTYQCDPTADRYMFVDDSDATTGRQSPEQQARADERDAEAATELVRNEPELLAGHAGQQRFNKALSLVRERRGRK